MVHVEFRSTVYIQYLISLPSRLCYALNQRRKVKKKNYLRYCFYCPNDGRFYVLCGPLALKPHIWWLRMHAYQVRNGKRERERRKKKILFEEICVSNIWILDNVGLWMSVCIINGWLWWIQSNLYVLYIRFY